jgi:transcriptional regulator with XRE-family HTH domain
VLGGLLMTNLFGSEVRRLRKNKGVDIQTLANRLNVSVGYLSNLETGKTENITFPLLEKLQMELDYRPLEFYEHSNTELDARLEQIKHQIVLNTKKHPEKIKAILKIFEETVLLLKD